MKDELTVMKERFEIMRTERDAAMKERDIARGQRDAAWCCSASKVGLLKCVEFALRADGLDDLERAACAMREDKNQMSRDLNVLSGENAALRKNVDLAKSERDAAISKHAIALGERDDARFARDEAQAALVLPRPDVDSLTRAFKDSQRALDVITEERDTARKALDKIWKMAAR